MAKRDSRRRTVFSSIFAGLAGLAGAVLGASSCAPNVTFGVSDCAGLESCGGACVDTSSDPLHCGGCGEACPDGASCEAGACGCAAGLAVCGGACVDLGANPAHCGGCSIACAAGTVCAGGVCQGGCPPGLTDCGGACVDTSSDPLHCGVCDAACPPGTACASGACGTSCPPGLDLCGGLCVDLATNPQNCGGCGIACGPGAGCAGGQCQPACGAGLTLCNGACVNLSTDAANCGGCGAACGPGEPCQGGMCVQCMGNSVCGVCDVQPIGPMVPATANGSTSGAQDHVDPSCAAGGSGERAYTFTAPAGGTYVFDTLMSGYDTVLALFDPATCDESACNDDTMGQLSQITATLAANQTVLVVVDGWNGQSGDYTLHVSTTAPGMCPDGDLGMMVPQTVNGSTTGAGNDIQAPCGGASADGQDTAFVFTAPMAGTYVFDTFGSSFDTVLHVHDGDCFGTTLACNDDTMGLQSTVTVGLTAGQVVVVVVDGWGNSQGNFVLHINGI